MILAGWTISARLLRVIMRQTMELPFVNGARVVGVSAPRLMIRHVLPESLDNLLVKWTADIGSTIVALSALSFIGVGAQPPSAEWGAMIAAAQGYIANAWWAVAAPGVAIVVTASAFGLLGDILQMRRDPALRARPTIASGSIK
jgi:peptide/nickel transport system permease protein